MEGIFGGCLSLEKIEIANGNQNFVSENGILFNKDKTQMIYILKTAINGTTFQVPNTVTNLTNGLIDIYQQIEKVYVPDSVTNINVEFFYDNKNITNIEIDENNQNYVSENGKIYNKDKTELYLYYLNEQTVDLKEEKIKKIKKFAFRMCTNLETIIFPDTLENTETQALHNLKTLKEVEIGKNVKNIDPLTFYLSRNIETMTIDTENPYYTVENNVIFNKDKTELITVLNEVTEYEIPNGVTKIGDRAFHGQGSLTKVQIPDTVKEIDVSFGMCGNLTQIEIPSSVETIASGCFISSNKLQKIIIHKPEGSISGAPWECPVGLRAVEWMP